MSLSGIFNQHHAKKAAEASHKLNIPPPGMIVSEYEWSLKSEAERAAYWRLPPLPSTEPPALKSPENQIDLATVYAMDANSLGLALVVGGKTVTYLISRTSAASLAGRIAEHLA